MHTFYKSRRKDGGGASQVPDPNLAPGTRGVRPKRPQARSGSDHDIASGGDQDPDATNGPDVPGDAPDAELDALLSLMHGLDGVAHGIRRSAWATSEAYERRYLGGIMGRIAREIPHVERMLKDEDFNRRSGSLPLGRGRPGSVRTAFS